MKKIYRKMMVLMNRKQKLKMIQILFMMVIGAILETVSIGLVVPAIQMIMDPSCVEGDSLLAQIYRWTGFQKPGYFTALILVLIILGFVLKNVFLYFQNVVQLRFVYTNQFETSQRMMINFMKRPYEYYLNADTSVIQRMITSDVNNMYGLILALLQLMSEVIIFVLLAVTLTAMAPQMILTIAALLIVTLLVIKQFLKPIMRQAGIENQDYYSGLYKWIEESVMGIKEIKIANKENYFIREYGKCGHGYVSAVQKYNIFNATPRLLIETVCMAGLILYLIFMILSGEDVTSMVSQLGAFGVAAMRLLPSANRINNYLTQISYFEPFFMGVSDNLQEEINDKNVVYDEAAYRRNKPVDKLPLQDKIVLDDIVYKYPNSEVLIFDHAHMEIPAGKSVALVGPSGGGKTTICSLLPRFYDVTAGKVTIDGKDVRDLTLKSLRNQIGMVQQDVYLFDGTIRENIAYGKPDATDEEIKEAARRANMDDFIMQLPKQYDTYVGEKGTRLSGGQKQRISIARVFLKNPPILILDEATSALDNESERYIQKSLEELAKNRTTITIAHRLSTIKRSDEIIVITEDGIAERGTHETLLAKNGIYARYYNL